MRRLTAWTARRAGAGLTILADDENGHRVKITGIDTIEAGTPHPLATDKDGVVYELQP